MKNLTRVFLAAILAVSVTSCGNNDPLELFNEPLPQLSTITSGGSYGLTVPYTPSTPYWQFPTFGVSSNALAPARGQIAEIGLDTQFNSGGYYVKIIHSGRMATKIVGINQAVLVRAGDYVVAGQPIGLFFSGSVYLQVIVDNKAVCPLSYMSDTFRSTFYTGVAGNPCR